MHLSEDDLILHYYGEMPERAGTPTHLAMCEECRGRLANLQRVLNSVDGAPAPERAPDYGQVVWAKLAPKVGRRKGWRAWFAPQRLVAIAVLAAALTISFLAGRYAPQPETQTVPIPGQLRERVLLVALGDHLERSKMILVEIANAPESKAVNIAGERAMAETLVEANRLYRQTAQATGQTGAVTVLDDLERVLLEIAHSPDDLSGEQLDELRRRIEDQGLLFKVRVFGSQIREPGKKLDPAASPIL